MKKFFILTITLILCVSLLTGCTRAAPPDFVPYWGQLEKDVEGEAEKYLEKSVFKISVKEPDATDKREFKLDPSCSGIYTTTLTRVSDDGKGSIYKSVNSFKFSGTYNGHSFSDEYKSEVTFRVDSKSFTTLTSTKEVKNYTFFNRDGTINSVSYKIKNQYVKKKVTSTVEINSDPDNILSGIKDTYRKSLGSYFFDNESLFYGIRSFKPNETFLLASYSLLDPIEQKLSKMKANFVAQEDDKNKVTLASTTNEDGTKAPAINGVPTQDIECNMIRTVITETNNTGAPIDLYYSKDTADYRAKYKIKNAGSDIENTVEVPYYFLVKINHGDMVYTLNTLDNQAKKA